jgi:hypothetical protein
MRLIFCFIMALTAPLSAPSASAQSTQKWVTSWTGSVQGPYPIGNPRPSPICDLPFRRPRPGRATRAFD